ncbi:S10e ribosomal protein [Salpingoeca rosetta]|uniref:S10e ribosomal protein n=1 Tax=Salpingoeca rosetta (strain ATCC 50818 / BSB-021) TaxID=946362 RepID=F2UJZ0_SALR5|nr:S10e ribosomal protein [Salpingoeca rosetta]EGD77439.1 S10e ribosomal protein [Salpingoeca rosetta]|eukprot:XP_004990327.1 S10e ribosomal protein [Salpingoeca rosetta]
MLIPKQTRKQIYFKLFEDGVMVAKKDFNAPSHPEFKRIPNLHVIKALQSLKSRGFVHEDFAFRHFYWRLTDEGIEYLRDYLHLPENVVPTTLKAPAREQRPTARRVRSMGHRAERTSRDAYRRDGDEGAKKLDAPEGDFKPEFRGGAGRGKFQGGQGSAQ